MEQLTQDRPKTLPIQYPHQLLNELDEFTYGIFFPTQRKNLYSLESLFSTFNYLLDNIIISRDQYSLFPEASISNQQINQSKTSLFNIYTSLHFGHPLVYAHMAEEDISHLITLIQKKFTEFCQLIKIPSHIRGKIIFIYLKEDDFLFSQLQQIKISCTNARLKFIEFN